MGNANFETLASRCAKFGVGCDGYEDTIELRRSNKKKPDSDRPSTVPILAPQLPTIPGPLTKSPFRDELEHQYFQLFREKLTPHLIGFFESDFWERLVFQASENDDSIRHALMAIAGLKAATEVTQTEKSAPLRDHLDAQDHHGFALRYYGKAIQSMRMSSLGGTQDLRTTLITCLLIMCFESFHGNHESAGKQVIIALGLIDQKFSTRLGPISTGPNVVEELMHIFERLDLASMSFFDIRSPSQHNLMCNLGQARVDRMPDRFSSVTDARAFLGIVGVRLAHLMHASCLVPGHVVP